MTILAAIVIKPPVTAETKLLFQKSTNHPFLGTLARPVYDDFYGFCALIWRIVYEGKVVPFCRLRRPTSQKRTYRAQKGAHQSATLAFLGNKSLIRGSRHERAIPLAPCARTCRNRTKLNLTLCSSMKLLNSRAVTGIGSPGLAFLNGWRFAI